MPSVMLFGGGGLWEELGHKGGAFMNRISALFRHERFFFPLSLLSAMLGFEKTDIRSPGREFLSDPGPASTLSLDLGLLSYENCEK